jgi:dipeptidyl-peptidase-4
MAFSSRTHTFRARAAVVFAAGVIFTSPNVYAQVHGEAAKQMFSQSVQRQGAFRVYWLPDGGILQGQRTAAGLEIYRVDPATGNRQPLLSDSAQQKLIAQYNKLSGQNATSLPFRSFQVEHDGQIYLFTGMDNASYLFDRQTNTVRKLTRPEIHPVNADALMRNLANSQLVNGTYSPDYTNIGFIRGYDLYVMNTTTGKETRLTTGGSDSLMSGRPDWVYPEELNQTEAFFWSPDGKKIAYLQFDERPVVPYPIIHDLDPQARIEWERYPVAGAPNPIVKLFVIDLATKKTVQIDTKSSSNVYIVRPTWSPDGSELLFQRLNRHQDTLQLLAANPKTGAIRTIITEHDSAYLNLDGGSPGFGATPPPLRFLKDGKRFFWPSERTGWRHWYLYNLQGKELAQVTQGQRVFNQIEAVDESKGVIYASAFTDEGQQEQLFSAKIDGSGVTQITHDEGMHNVSVEPTADYYVDVFSSPTQSPVAAIHDMTGKSLRKIGEITYNFQGNTVTSPQRVTVKAADGTTNLHGLLYTPLGFDSTKKYPLLVHVYGGPQVQQVDGGNAQVNQYQLEAQDGYMVWVVDNRGTPNRGRAFERATYLKLGQVDLDDQATAVRELIKSHPYIDSTRVGIMGASYGGYMSALALLRYPDVFQVGVAISAVTDWRNYDAPYTERYMRTPQENQDGYDKGSTLTNAGNLQGHLMIMHGTTDNNVHLGNAIQLVQKLQQAGKDFELMLYPEERHGVTGDQLAHEYLAKYLKPVPVQ